MHSQSMNLIPMFFACLLIAGLAYRAGHDHIDKGMNMLSLVALVMIMWRGFYWNIFGRGHGFFSANRVSALVLLFVVYWVAWWKGNGRYLREEGGPD